MQMMPQQPAPYPVMQTAVPAPKKPAGISNYAALFLAAIGAILLYLGYDRMSNTLDLMFHALDSDYAYIKRGVYYVCGGGAAGLLGALSMVFVRRSRRRTAVGWIGLASGLTVAVLAGCVMLNLYENYGYLLSR